MRTGVIKGSMTMTPHRFAAKIRNLGARVPTATVFKRILAGCNWFVSRLDVRRGGSSRAYSFGLRAMSAVLLAFFLLPLFIPIFNLGSESTLPTCCRRDGKHRCAMFVHFRHPVLGASSEPILSATIPACPYRLHWLMPPVSRALFAPSVSVFSVLAVSYPALGLETTLLTRLPDFRSHRKRGPPSLLA